LIGSAPNIMAVAVGGQAADGRGALTGREDGAAPYGKCSKAAAGKARRNLAAGKAASALC
jgi:hypothetical protein